MLQDDEFTGGDEGEGLAESVDSVETPPSSEPKSTPKVNSHLPIVEEEFTIDVPVLDGGKILRTNTYYCHTKNFIGNGGFGKVYKVFPVINGAVDESKPFAMKVVKENNFRKNEAEFFRHYYFAEEPTHQNGNVYFVMELLPGDDLFVKGEVLNPIFDKLPFGMLLEIFQALCASINSLHHNTLKVGKAIAHRDLKGSNIKVRIDQNNAVHVYLYDFGLSDFLLDISDLPGRKGHLGSYFYLAPELLTKEPTGAKGDIYAMAGILLALLGGEPFEAKKLQINLVEKINSPYSFSNFLQKHKEEAAQIAYVVPLLRRFINRMQHVDPSQRPGSDELLKFSSCLNSTYKLTLARKNKFDQLKKVKTLREYKHVQAEIKTIADSLQNHNAAMILMANNFYDKNTSAYFFNDYFAKKIIEREPFLNEHGIKTILEEMASYDKKVLEVKSIHKELTRNGFSKNVTAFVEAHLEDHPFAMQPLLNKLLSYEDKAKKHLNTIFQIYQDYEVTLTFEELKNLIDNGVNVLFIAKKCAEVFKQKNEIEQPPRGMFSFFAYTSAEEVVAAKNFIGKIEGSASAIFSEEDKKILLQSRLAPVLNDLHIFDRLSVTPLIKQTA